MNVRLNFKHCRNTPSRLSGTHTWLPEEVEAVSLLSRSRQDRVDAKGLMTCAAPVDGAAGGAPIAAHMQKQTVGLPFPNKTDCKLVSHSMGSYV